MTATFSIYRDDDDRLGAHLQPGNLAAPVGAYAPCHLLAPERIPSRQGPDFTTRIGAMTSQSCIGPADDRYTVGCLGARDPWTWTKATKCSSTPPIRRKPGWWCSATAG